MENADYYLERKKALMGQASGFSEGLKAAMDPACGADEADLIAARMVELYEGMIGDLPYIGGTSNQDLTDILIQCSQSMAYCLAMRERGKSFDDAGRFNFLVVAEYLKENPQPPDRRSVDQKRSDCARSAAWTREHAHEYPEGWVAEYVEETSDPFTHGIDYVRCGNLGLCRRLGIPEFAPYICMIDKLTYEARGQGLTRTTALSLGSDRCDFRFSEDGVVRLGEPFIVERFREWGISG